MTPLVSVIIPTHNRWPWVGEAVQSVLGQDSCNFELIVVDDGSTDRTAEELGKLSGDLHVIKQKRGGVAAARNRGVTLAHGQYIAFLDSDDYWLPGKLAAQTAFMERNKHVEICQTEEIWIRRGVRVNARVKHRKPSGDIFQRSLELCLVSPSAVMMTRKLFDEMGGFDESFWVCEDYDLWLRIAVDHRVDLIATPLVIKRGGHADQLSRSTWGMDRYRVAALQKLLRTGLRGEKRKWAGAALKQKVEVLARGARNRGKEDEAHAYYAILSEFIQGGIDVGRSNAPICAGQRISSEDVDALAGLGTAR